MEAPFQLFQATTPFCSLIPKIEGEKTPWRGGLWDRHGASCLAPQNLLRREAKSSRQLCGVGSEQSWGGWSNGDGREGRWAPTLVPQDWLMEGLSTTDLPGKPLGMLPGFD